jgi:hypothetical protein
VDSYTAFQKAIQIVGSDVTSVSRLGTANSVWICQRGTQNLAVIKAFASDTHSREHFQAEAKFLSENQAVSFVPELLHADFEGCFIVTRYHLTDENSQVELRQIFDVIDQDFAPLKVPFQVHESLPGILDWWNSESGPDSPGQRLIHSLLLDAAWLSNALIALKTSWQSSSVMHGDLKIANLALSNASFKILDWENVGSGNSLWDKAGLIQSVFAESLGEGTLAPWARKQIASCLDLLSESSDQLALGVAARLVQTAIELASNATGISPYQVNILQMAEMLANGNWTELGRLEHIA